MKLKKIASLMLAGVMAVSMLTACDSGNNGGNGNNGNNGGEPTPSASYTSTVLAETNKSTQAKLSASSNTKLDKAVGVVAENFTISKAPLNTVNVMGKDWKQVTAVEDIMYGAEYSPNALNATGGWDFSPEKVGKSKTYYTLAYASRAMTDDYITELVADFLDLQAEKMVDDEKVVEGYTWDYTVSVSKADCVQGNKADRSKDCVIVGIAITATKTEVKY